jgi:hypothetical protein
MKRSRFYCNVYCPDDHETKLVFVGHGRVMSRKVATRKPNRARQPRYSSHINELPALI